MCCIYSETSWCDRMSFAVLKILQLCHIKTWINLCWLELRYFLILYKWVSVHEMISIFKRKRNVLIFFARKSDQFLFNKVYWNEEIYKLMYSKFGKKIICPFLISYCTTWNLTAKAQYEVSRNKTQCYISAQLQETCRNGGNVLIATDTGGRVLEMTHMLEQMWTTRESGLSAYSLAILSNTGYHVIHFAKQMVIYSFFKDYFHFVYLLYLQYI